MDATPTKRKRFNDLTGQTFGRWTVIERTGTSSGQPTWKCQCKCGTVKEGILSPNLREGRSQSCGCYRADLAGEINRKHGRSRTRAYTAWQQMKVRCYNDTRREWKNYGGRGITVCDRWIGEDGFENFFADMGNPPWGYSLDRKENDKGYSKDNCRWADDFTQGRNKRNTRWVDWKGQQRTMTEVAILEGVDYNCMRNKVFLAGMTLEEAVADCVARGLKYVERSKAKRTCIVLTEYRARAQSAA